jgi:hypothetical protein
MVPSSVCQRRSRAVEWASPKLVRGVIAEHSARARRNLASSTSARSTMAAKPVASSAYAMPMRRRRKSSDRPAAGQETRGKNGKDQRSFAFAKALGRETDLAQLWGLTAPERTRANAAPNRRAGGHWFEPGTAHLEPCSGARRRFLARVRWVADVRRAHVVLPSVPPRGLM